MHLTKFVVIFLTLLFASIFAAGCQKNSSPTAPAGTLTPVNIINTYLTPTPAPDFVSTATQTPGVYPTYTPVESEGWVMTGFWHMQDDTACPDYAGRVTPSASNITFVYNLIENGTFDNGDHNSGSLISPYINLSAGSVLKFSSLSETECSGNCSYDKRSVFISINGGKSWMLLMEMSDDTWEDISIPLNYPGYGVILKFEFDTIDSVMNNHAGWYIDDIRIETP